MVGTHNSYDVSREPPDKSKTSVHSSLDIGREEEVSTLSLPLAAGNQPPKMDYTSLKQSRPRSDSEDDDFLNAEGFQPVKTKKSRANRSNEITPPSSPILPSSRPIASTSTNSEPLIVIVSSTTNEPIFRNPMKTEKAVSSSIFAPHLTGVKTQVLGKGCSLKLFINPNSPKFPLREISSLSQNFPHEIKCFSPSLNYLEEKSSGVIYPICPEVPLEELASNLRVSEGPSSAIIKVSPVFTVKDGCRVRSDRVRVDFAGKLPHRVCCGFSSYKVLLFFPEPLRCFNCQKYGHGTYTCRFRERCRICGDAYNSTDHSRFNRCSKTHFCIHCRVQGHCSGAISCPVFKKAKEIVKDGVINNTVTNTIRQKLADLNNPSFHLTHNALPSSTNHSNQVHLPLTSEISYAQMVTRQNHTVPAPNSTITHSETTVDVHPVEEESMQASRVTVTPPETSRVTDKPRVNQNRRAVNNYPVSSNEINSNRPIPPLIHNVPNYSNVNQNKSNLNSADLGNFLFQLLILLHKETSKDFIPIFETLCKSCFGVSAASELL